MVQRYRLPDTTDCRFNSLNGNEILKINILFYYLNDFNENTLTLQLGPHHGDERGEQAPDGAVQVVGAGRRREQQPQHQAERGLHVAAEHGARRVHQHGQRVQRPHLPSLYLNMFNCKSLFIYRNLVLRHSV